MCITVEHIYQLYDVLKIFEKNGFIFGDGTRPTSKFHHIAETMTMFACADINIGSGKTLYTTYSRRGEYNPRAKYRIMYNDFIAQSNSKNKLIILN